MRSIAHAALSVAGTGSSAQRHSVETFPGPAASGLSASFVQRLSGGASRLAALLLPQILPVSSVVAPCQPGAALRNPLHN